MDQIARGTETDLPYWDWVLNRVPQDDQDVSDSVTQSAVIAAYRLNLQAIVVPTASGRTAKVGGPPPAGSVLAVTHSVRTQRQLKLIFGVRPVVNDQTTEIRNLLYECADDAVRFGAAASGDLIAIVAGLSDASSAPTCSRCIACPEGPGAPRRAARKINSVTEPGSEAEPRCQRSSEIWTRWKSGIRKGTELLGEGRVDRPAEVAAVVGPRRQGAAGLNRDADRPAMPTCSTPRPLRTGVEPLGRLLASGSGKPIGQATNEVRGWSPLPAWHLTEVGVWSEGCFPRVQRPVPVGPRPSPGASRSAWSPRSCRSTSRSSSSSKCAAALVGGNAVVVKPPIEDPLVVGRFREALIGSEFPLT